MLVIIGLAVIMFGGMIAVGAQKPLPATPTPQITPTMPTTSPQITPTQPVGLLPQRFYTQQNTSDGRSLITVMNHKEQTLFTVDIDATAGTLFQVSADGLNLYVVRDNGVSAFDTMTGAQRWHVASEVTSLADRSLLLSPNGNMLVLISRAYDQNFVVNRVLIEQFFSVNGALLQRMEGDASAQGDYGIDSQNRLWSFNRPKFTILDLQTNSVITYTDAPERDFIAQMSRDGRTAYIATEPGVIGVINITDQTIKTRPLTYEGTFIPYRLMVSDNGAEFVVTGAQIGKPQIRDQKLNFGGDVTLIAGNQQENYADRTNRIDPNLPFTFSPLDQQVYVASVTTLNTYNLARATLNRNLFTLGNIGSFIIAPDVPWYPSSQPTVTPLAPPTEIPVAPPISITQNDDRVFAWLWHRDTQKVTAYRCNGQSEIVANNALFVLPRPNQPPRMILSNVRDGWQIYDPVTNITTPIQMQAPRSVDESYRTNANLLSPDGNTLALKVDADVVANDAFTATTQLITLDVQSGAVNVLGDSISLPNFSYSQVLMLRDNQIYYAPTILRSGSAVPSAIWRVDTTTGQATKLPYELVDQTGQSVIMDVNQAQGIILYQRYSDADNAWLYTLDVDTGEEERIFTSRFVSIDEAKISPDGQHIAFLIRNDQSRALLSVFQRNVKTILQTTVKPFFFARLQWQDNDTIKLVENIGSSNQRFEIVNSHYNLDGTVSQQSGDLTFEAQSATATVQLGSRFSGWGSSYVSLFEANASEPSVSIPLEPISDPRSVQIVWVGE